MLLTPQSQNTSFFDKLNSISPTSPISKVLKTVIQAITITLIILSTQSATAINSINHTYDDQLALSKYTPLTHTNSAYNTLTPTTPESSLPTLNQRYEIYSYQTPTLNKHLRHLTANFLQRTETKPSTSPTATYNITVLFLSSSVSTQPNKGLHHYKFRHYSAELGRWLGRDPIEESGGINLYAFVGNDGVNLWDWLGLVSPYNPGPNGQNNSIFRPLSRPSTILPSDYSLAEAAGPAPVPVPYHEQGEGNGWFDLWRAYMENNNGTSPGTGPGAPPGGYSDQIWIDILGNEKIYEYKESLNKIVEQYGRTGTASGPGLNNVKTNINRQADGSWASIGGILGVGGMRLTIKSHDINVICNPRTGRVSGSSTLVISVKDYYTFDNTWKQNAGNWALDKAFEGATLGQADGYWMYDELEIKWKSE